MQGLWSRYPLSSLNRREPAPTIPSEEPMTQVCEDYAATGWSLDAHPIALIRAELEPGMCETIQQVKRAQGSRRVSIMGLVTSRQRPGTANGVVFVTLEDETDMMQAVVWPKVWERFRRLVGHATTVGIEGKMQREGEAISVLVERFWSIEEAVSNSSKYKPVPLVSRDFK